ncbi:MAG TPA: type VI secretion system tip protein TssI/VgrG [Telluria sp.]|jgi:type VI secretion system secreted protein VgrG
MPIQANRNVRVSTALGADVLLFHRMAGSEALSELGEYRLDLLSEAADLAIGDVLGHALTVKVDVSGGLVREFSGIVTRFAMTGRSGRYCAYQATVRPWLWLLTRSADCRIFQSMDAVTIIKEVFAKYALADVDLTHLSASPPSMPYCVQYRETDFAFVSRLLERFGIYYFFRHAGGRHTLVLADSGASHHRIAGNATLQYFPDGVGRAGPQETVHRWHTGGEILSDAVALAAFNFETPAAALAAKSRLKRDYDGAAGNLEMYDYPGAFTERAAGAAEARIRLDAIEAGYETVQGASSAVTLAPGALFTLSGHPRADQNGEMLVVGASYTLHSDRFEPEPAVAAEGERVLAPPFECQFSAIDSARAFRSAQQTPRPIMRGPQTAIVVGNPGEEIWTDKYGRVKVKFHWDRVGDPDQHAEQCSCWVRVAQAWAGKRFGQLFIPRVGQEVVVSFLEGDPDQPLVTGAVYNALNMPPVGLPEQASQSTIKTCSTKGGEGFNQLRFEDKKNAEEVFMQAERDFNRVVGNNDTLKVGFQKKDGGDQTISIFHNQSLDVGNDRTVHVKHDQRSKIDNDLLAKIGKDLKASAGGAMVFEATTSIELKVGASSITIEADKVTIKAPQVALKADAMMTIKAGGVLSAEGALVKIN